METKEYTVEELEQMLKDKKKREQEQKRKEKEQKQRLKEDYETKRNELVTNLVGRALVLHNQMRDYKQYCMEQLEAFRELAHEYGGIRSNSKGGFSIRHSGSFEMVSLDRNTTPEYDERAALAENLLKEFLEDKVKKRDLKHYRTITALMARNKQGDFTPARIASLLKIKDNYSDERWVKAMELFEESFRNREISYSVSFYRKDDMGKDKAITLTFASIPVNLLKTEEQENQKG